MKRARRPAVAGAGEPAPWRRTHTGARDRILDAAEHLIAEDGFDATPTARIAERAGVAKGLLFYYFPRKTDLLHALFAERLPAQPLCSISDIAVAGDVSGSLVRLAHRLNSPPPVPRAAGDPVQGGGNPDRRGPHLGALHAGLVDLTERVLDAASPRALDQHRRRQAAGTYVAVLLHEANARRSDGPLPDVAAAADIISRALTA